VVETDTAEGHGEDVDGAAELAKLEARHGSLPATLEVISPSGSIHRYFNHPGFKIKNSASEIGSGIDVRGDGGMVVGPPSIKIGKGVYRWRNELPIADAPQWLLDRIVAGKEKPQQEPAPALSISQRAAALIVDPRAVHRAETPHKGAILGAFGSGFSRAYLDRALDGERAIVAQASKGGRNHQLNKSSFAVGQLVPHGLGEREVIETMYDAAVACGYVADEGHSAAMATINSGVKAGIADPRPMAQPKQTASVQTSDNVIQLPGTAKAKLPGSGLVYFDQVEEFVNKNWLMKGVIAKGETSMWIAPPGKLKSALMADLAICLASGMDWRGYQSKATAGVVYFALERGDLVKRRFAAHRKREGLSGLPIAVRGGIINLMDKSCVDIIIATIREAEQKFGCSVGFAVFDTLAKGIAAGGGDENQAKDMGAALANLRLAQEQTGAHIAIVAHTGKDEKKGARGSSSQGGDVDVLVQITGDGAIKVATVTKANDQEEGPLTSFKGEIVVIRVDQDGDEITTMIVSTDLCGGKTSKSDVRAPLSPTERRAMDMLINAINEVGRPPPPAGGFPQGVVKVVTSDQWRTSCKRGGLSAGDTDDGFRRAFKRVNLSLANKYRIGTLDDWVWVVYSG
jgi:hypothetical protein